MLKKDLRLHYKNMRQALSLDEIEDKSLAIANNLLKMDIWDNIYFHLFLTMQEQREVHTEFILNILAGKDKEVIVSRSDFETHTMIHFLLTDNTRLIKNQFGIPEPVDGIEVPSNKIDVVFVPLLAFDNNGQRVGYGKGFYDRFLNECKQDVVTIGLSFFEAEEEAIEANTTDVPMDYCVTPLKVYSFVR